MVSESYIQASARPAVDELGVKSESCSLGTLTPPQPPSRSLEDKGSRRHGHQCGGQS